VEPRVHARHGADIAFAPAIFAQFTQPFGNGRAIRQHRATVTDGAEILGRIDAETGYVGDRAEPPTAEHCAVALRAILDHLGAVPPRHRHDSVEIGGL